MHYRSKRPDLLDAAALSPATSHYPRTQALMLGSCQPSPAGGARVRVRVRTVAAWRARSTRPSPRFGAASESGDDAAGSRPSRVWRCAPRFPTAKRRSTWEGVDAHGYIIGGARAPSASRSPRFGGRPAGCLGLAGERTMGGRTGGRAGAGVGIAPGCWVPMRFAAASASTRAAENMKGARARNQDLRRRRSPGGWRPLPPHLTPRARLAQGEY
ncbi:hypothetical protein BC628DRAFT_142380 [Trametes gibbosa]|nr:hypothetical protein BC628DRAFT_142380 [Trametes gibbosa]